jgi:hypothetical protein
MHCYKGFLIGADGKLLDVRFAERDDDGAACEWAETLRARNPECRGVELWDETRLVWRTPAP